MSHIEDHQHQLPPCNHSLRTMTKQAGIYTEWKGINIENTILYAEIYNIHKTNLKAGKSMCL